MGGILVNWSWGLICLGSHLINGFHLSTVGSDASVMCGESCNLERNFGI